MTATGVQDQALANALKEHQRGRFAEAEQLYLNILAHTPEHADATHLLGMLAFQRGNYTVAEELIRKAITAHPDQALYHSNLGIVLQAQGKLMESASCYRRAIQLKPDYTEAHNNLGVTLEALGQREQAMLAYQRVLKLNPNHADSHTNLGVMLFEQGNIAGAISHYREALLAKPGCAETWSNLGNSFEARDQLNEAIDCYIRAVELKPDYSTAFGNLGNALQSVNQFEEALACYQRVLALKPDSADAHHSKALCQLLQGDFAAGWMNYEWRWETTGHVPRRSYTAPLWKGEKLHGGKLLLWGEQGIGDEVMFAGLLPEVVQTGNRCVLDCDPRLQPLFARSFPRVEVVSGYHDAGSDLTAQVPTGSLPRLFRKGLSDFRRGSCPYLLPDSAGRSEFRLRYADQRPLIGIAWRTKNEKNGRRRSIDLSHLSPLLNQEAVRWISLQYGDHEALEAQVREAHAPIFVDRTVDQLADIDTFAAQLSALDLVITIDNSTAHLAGALGLPVWVLLPFARDWRWLVDSQTSPWYPSMRLFRQPKHGDWESVVAMVRNHLSTWLAGFRQQP